MLNRYRDKLPSLNIAAFWNMVPYNLAAGYEQFGGRYPFLLCSEDEVIRRPRNIGDELRSYRASHQRR
jgi:hypothetical protein